MDEKRKIDFVVVGHDDASKVLDNVGNRIDRLAKKGSGVGFDIGPVDELKRLFGPRGPIKDLTEIFVGGGAVAGASFYFDTLAKGFDVITEKAKQYRQEGTLAIDEVAASMIKTVPIVGQFADSATKLATELLIINAQRGIKPNGPGVGVDLEASEKRDKVRATSDTLFTQIDTSQKTANAPTEFEKQRIAILAQQDQKLKDLRESRKSEVESLGGGNVGEAGLFKSGRADKFAAEEFKVRDAAAANLAKVNKAEIEAREKMVTQIGGAIAQTGEKFFGSLLSGAAKTAAGPATGLIGLFAGLASRKGGTLPAGISDALPTLQSEGTGMAESARDRLGVQAADDRREAARIRKKQAEDVEKMKKALEYIRDQIAKGNPGNALTALFAPR